MKWTRFNFMSMFLMSLPRPDKRALLVGHCCHALLHTVHSSGLATIRPQPSSIRDCGHSVLTGPATTDTQWGPASWRLQADLQAVLSRQRGKAVAVGRINWWDTGNKKCSYKISCKTDKQMEDSMKMGAWEADCENGMTIELTQEFV
jgi:hypothetical protein